MRDIISVLYQGNWADRVAKMSDAQVAVIYQRHINKQNLEAYDRRVKIRLHNHRPKETTT